jgi:hypothetical protein
MCKYIHHYGWGVGASFSTHTEARKQLYKKRRDMRKHAAQGAIVILRDEQDALMWRNFSNGEDYTVSIMRQPTGTCCPAGISFDRSTPYVPVKSGDLWYGYDRERIAQMDRSGRV